MTQDDIKFYMRLYDLDPKAAFEKLLSKISDLERYAYSTQNDVNGLIDHLGTSLGE